MHHWLQAHFMGCMYMVPDIPTCYRMCDICWSLARNALRTEVHSYFPVLRINQTKLEHLSATQ